MERDLPIVLRCWNDAAILPRTLAALAAQEGVRWRLLVIDSASTDGSVPLLMEFIADHGGAAAGHALQALEPGAYLSSAVLNQGMARAQGEEVAFLNSDAVLATPTTLATLVDELQKDARAAAAFARQIPHPGAGPIACLDLEQAFDRRAELGPGAAWLSMVCCVVRRTAWAEEPFDPRLTFAEDAVWSARAMQRGWRIAYVPAAVVAHSHDLTAVQFRRRAFGDAAALAMLATQAPPGRLRGWWLPWLRRSLRDGLRLIRRGHRRALGSLLHHRWAQLSGHWQGAWAGWRHRHGAGSLGRVPVLSSADHTHRRPADAGFDALLTRHLDGIATSLRQRLPQGLVCLALGGGYGRGEGGIDRRQGDVRPYNDYDLVLIHRLPASVAAAACAAVAAEWSPRCFVHVDVTPLHARRIPRLPPALTWYELGQGHRLVLGDGGVLAPLRDRRLDHVEPSEWGRLLLNRACGILFARWRLAGIPGGPGDHEDAGDFIQRQIEKTWLALGDVWLAQRGAYHHLLAERVAAMARHRDQPPWGARWQQAAAFKSTPTPVPTPTILIAEVEQLAPLLADALEVPVAPNRPLAALARTLRSLPRSRWFTLPPWTAPRERLRQAVRSELIGHSHDRERLIGSPAQLTAWWSQVA